MRSAATTAADAEHAPLPAGDGERFAGYGVMGLPFRSGHVLALRRFPASSIGPAYTSVWHRAPDGRWSFWQDQPDDRACSRYFSAGLQETRQVEIGLTWPSPSQLRVVVPDVDLAWTVQLATTAATRVLNGLARALPERAWRSRAVLSPLGRVAGRALGAGRLGMVGASPNGQRFTVNPRLVWVVDDSTAHLAGDDLGPPGPLDEQARLGGFWIPQRGLFAVGRAFFEVADPRFGAGTGR